MTSKTETRVAYLDLCLQGIDTFWLLYGKCLGRGDSDNHLGSYCNGPSKK